MDRSTANSKAIHQGRNVKRFREMLGIKQEALAFELGEGWNQKNISKLEQKEEIDTDLLSQISAVLKLPIEAFQNFDEEHAVHIISNSFHPLKEPLHDKPINKLIRIHEEKIALYERMLKEKDEIMAKLDRLIADT